MVYAILFLLAALYHLVNIFFAATGRMAWRHALFVAIDLFCMYATVKRPRYFLFLFCILFVQQYYSHGSYMIRLWEEEGRIHWISLAELILLPVALICFIEDIRERNGRR